MGHLKRDTSKAELTAQRAGNSGVISKSVYNVAAVLPSESRVRLNAGMRLSGLTIGPTFLRRARFTCRMTQSFTCTK